MIKKKTRHKLRLLLLNGIFLVLCLSALVPILYALSMALSQSGSGLSSGTVLFPEHPTLENFRVILFDKPFMTWLKNSILLSGGTVLIAIGFAVWAAYAFSRYRFKGRKTVLQLLLLLNAFPQILTMFAIFRLMKTMNLLNRHIGLIIIYAGSMCIFAIWNLKGYFDSIPVEIEEASKIDGANDSKMLLKIILPLASPAIIVTAVMVLIFVWNEYLFATTFMLSEGNYTLAGGLYQLQTGDYGRNWPLFSAASILVSVPVLIIFFCIQKYMVSGLTAGGVKG
jgi:arabinogalactan oligomer/maltooligosaccharide transport system permease protein